MIKSTSSSPLWIFWSCGLAATWLMPTLSPPWLCFDQELLIAILSLIAAIVFAGKQKTIWIYPRAAKAIFIVAAIPLIQWATGLIGFFGDAWINTLYLISFSGAILIGSMGEHLLEDEWAMWLFLGIGIASFLSVGLQLYQYAQLDYLTIWAVGLAPGDRPYGNLAQPNLLATLLCWGLIGLWWGYLRGNIRAVLVMPAALFLLLGIVMTGSRTAWLNIGIWLPLATFIFRRSLRAQKYWRGLAALWAAFFLLNIGWIAGPTLNSPDIDTTAGRLNPGTRGFNWLLMADAVKESPWIGWGWGQVPVAQVHAIQNRSTPPSVTPELLHYSHNIILDLMIWNGAPLGIAAALLIAFWLFRQAKMINDAKSAIYFMAIGVIAIHANLEYPFAYLMFLLPLGFFIGGISYISGAVTQKPLLYPAVLGAILAAAIALSWTTADYLKAKHSLEQLRFESARIGTSRNSQPPNLQLLTQLEAWLTVDRLKPSSKFLPETRTLIKKTYERYPSDVLMFKYAIAEVGSGHYEEAGKALSLICRLYSTSTCQRAQENWETLGKSKFPFLASTPFPQH